MLLWFGWFGFNAGSALKSNYKAVLAAVNTNIAPVVSLITWSLLDYLRNIKPSVKAMCSGIVCGMASITPGAGLLRVWASFAVGILATLAAYFTSVYRDRYKIFDDRLDVFSCHAVCGVIGSLSVGLFYCDITLDGTSCDFTTGCGLIYGDAMQLLYQLIGVFATLSYAFIASYFIIALISQFLDVSAYVNLEEEENKLDLNEYELPSGELRITNNEIFIR